MGDPTKGQGSTQKLPKHHSFASSTQDSMTGENPKPYQSGANVHKGKSARPIDGTIKRAPARGSGGNLKPMPAAQPRKQTF